MRASVRDLVRRRPLAAGLGAGAIVLAGGLLLVAWFRFGGTKPALASAGHGHGHGATVVPASLAADEIALSPGQEGSIGLKLAPVVQGSATDVVAAPGQIVPDETRFAYITPRASGVVRAVAAREGQAVKAGDLLALIDSPDVAQARFDLYTQLQELEVAQSQAGWEETIYANTMMLLERLQAGDAPDAIDKALENRPIGTSREQLIRAYTNLRLARTTFERNQELHRQQIISVKQFDVARTEFEAAQATYQSLTEQMAFNARIARTKAQQALRKAETAARVARARLRMLGVNPDGTLTVIQDGKVQGVNRDGAMLTPEVPDLPPTPEAAAANAAATTPAAPGSPANPAATAAASASGAIETAVEAAQGTIALTSDKPVSTYPVWAPFDGTVIDRMMIVPGVSVDLTSRLFTLADLSTVWVEVHVHESDYGAIAAGRHAEVAFTSPAYPGRTFTAEVLYAGDLVDPKTRTLRLMARAQNPERQLKPGMFVEVRIRIPDGRQALLIPTSALLTEKAEQLVFVKTGEHTFARRPVVVGSQHANGTTEILKGLTADEQVVVEGGFKLKAGLTLQREEQPQPAAGNPPGPAPGAPAAIPTSTPAPAPIARAEVGR